MNLYLFIDRNKKYAPLDNKVLHIREPIVEDLTAYLIKRLNHLHTSGDLWFHL